ncbi:N,N-dimethylformamidase beta subunit family domain-containing protein [Novipirellula sp. SH528]|uniref:N,N-dimethylformamidase beta subunit family domain-containing protein n=1 Tax=Novipirellula sp. SH528 TaxID=3454466 RepID=UPI003FA063B7
MNRLPDRRQLLSVAAATGTSLMLPKHASSADVRSAAVKAENEKPGTQEWMLRKTRIDPVTKYRCPWIEGYVSHASILPGETLQVMVSTDPVSEFTIEFYRLGYYGGDGGRLVHASDKLQGSVQKLPSVGPRRLQNCQWPASFEMRIPEDWVSGVYVGKLTELTEGLQSYVIFIVRDTRPAELMFQCSDHTWQAYNRWPSQFSLYDDGETPWHWGGESQVSFNRPYGKYCQISDAPLSIGSGEFFLWEFPFVYWLEREGYDVTYVSNTDLHRDAGQPLRCDGFLSVGHDEYWTIKMFRNLQAAIASGVSVGFFSGNAVCGRIEWDDATRSLHRVGVFGPPGGTREFSSMSTLKHERPYANELVGAHSTGPVTGGADWVCSQPDHWLYAATQMQRGDAIPGVIGWEWHGDPADIAGLEIVARGPTQSAPGVTNGGEYTATVYPGPKNNIVFNAATCWWADGLSEPPGYVRPSVYTSPQGPDPRLQQITHNVLRRMKRN